MLRVAGSIVVLGWMLGERDRLTPDLLHFVTCLDEDIVHLLSTFVLWACYKNFLVPTSDDYVNQNSAIALIEALVAIAFDGTNVSGAVCVFTTLILILNLRH